MNSVIQSIYKGIIFACIYAFVQIASMYIFLPKIIGALIYSVVLFILFLIYLRLQYNTKSFNHSVIVTVFLILVIYFVILLCGVVPKPKLRSFYVYTLSILSIISITVLKAFTAKYRAMLHFSKKTVVLSGGFCSLYLYPSFAIIIFDSYFNLLNIAIAIFAILTVILAVLFFKLSSISGDKKMFKDYVIAFMIAWVIPCSMALFTSNEIDQFASIYYIFVMPLALYLTILIDNNLRNKKCN